MKILETILILVKETYTFSFFWLALAAENTNIDKWPYRLDDQSKDIIYKRVDWLKRQKFEKTFSVEFCESFDKNINMALTFDGDKFYSHIKSIYFYKNNKILCRDDNFRLILNLETRGGNRMINILDEDNKYMSCESLIFPVESIVESYNDLMNDKFLLSIFEKCICPINELVTNVHFLSLLKVAFQHPKFGVSLKWEYYKWVKILDKNIKTTEIGRQAMDCYTNTYYYFQYEQIVSICKKNFKIKEENKKWYHFFEIFLNFFTQNDQNLTRERFEYLIVFIEDNLDNSSAKIRDEKEIDNSIKIVCCNFTMLEASLQLNFDNFEKKFVKFHEIIQIDSNKKIIGDSYIKLKNELIADLFVIKKQIEDLFYFFTKLCDTFLLIIFHNNSKMPFYKEIVQKYQDLGYKLH